MRSQDGLDRVGPDLLAPGHDDVADPAVHLQPAVLVEDAGITRGKPTISALWIRLDAAAADVTTKQHRSSQQDLSVLDAHIDAVQPDAVVDDARARLGH